MARWTLEYLVSGATQVQSEGRTFRCEAPSILLVPPFVPYIVEWNGASGRWTEIYAIFDPPLHWSTLLSGFGNASAANFCNLSNATAAQEIETALRTAFDLQRAPRIHREQLACNALERALLVWDEVNPRHGHVQREERIEKTLAFIGDQYSQPMSVETLARQVFLSPSRFSHLFKLQMQQSPMQYLEEFRLDRAAEQLLSKRDSIEQIANSVGFSNAFHFSTRFRRRFGRSPSRYRLNPKV